MLNTIQKYKSQIEENTKQIAILEQENEQLKTKLAALITANPQALIELLLNNSAEPASIKPTEDIKTFVSIKFNKNSNKIYDYIYVDTEPVKVGDFVVVDTPYQGEIEVEVVDVKQLNMNNIAPYDYKEARLAIRPF